MITPPWWRSTTLRARVIRARSTSAVLLALLLAAGGCSPPRVDNPPPPPAPTPPTTAGLSCDQRATRDACSEILVNGVRWRYSLARAATATTRTAIVDPGGPGISALDGGYLALFWSRHPALAATHNVLVVEEPWATREPTEPCRAALTDFYLAARTLSTGQVDASSARLATTCRTGGQPPSRWGFDRRSYSELIAAIGKKEALDYTGFIGHSFGSVRLTYLSGTPTIQALDWAVLVRPFPVGVTADALVAARADRIRRLTRHLAATSPASPSANPSLTRALPVTRFDEVSAAIELGYLTDDEQPTAARDVAGGAQPATTARLSDQLWQRYGNASIAPGYLSMLDEICAAVGRPSTRGDQIEAVLATALLPCRPTRAPLAAPPPLRLGQTELCVVTSAWDTVAPAALATRAFRDSSTRTRWISSDRRSHRSDDGLDACLSGQPPTG